MIEYMNIEELQNLAYDTLSYQDFIELRNNEYVGNTYYYGIEDGLSCYSFDIMENGKLIDNITVYGL